MSKPLCALLTAAQAVDPTRRGQSKGLITTAPPREDAVALVAAAAPASASPNLQPRRKHAAHGIRSHPQSHIDPFPDAPPAGTNQHRAMSVKAHGVGVGIRGDPRSLTATISDRP